MFVKPKRKLKSMQVRFADDTHDKITEAAKENGVSRSEIVRQGMDQLFKPSKS